MIDGDTISRIVGTRSLRTYLTGEDPATGDTVRLASGGPPMLVTSIDAEGFSDAAVCWFDKHDHLQRAAFPLGFLVKVETPELPSDNDR
ncbi:YodC family protein [Enterovirga sp. CN4-39]|uniref:YodC family protein n=1 Tax=Enterovirga sp. CN4-39 TaxID=3400910 RepID=UPI003BFBE2D7